jgi:hypothetical protein
MMLSELDAVVLERDLPAYDLRRGDVGAVVQVLGDEAVEVEFVRASGRTQALVELNIGDVRRLGDEDLLAVRQVGPRSRGAA